MRQNRCGKKDCFFPLLTNLRHQAEKRPAPPGVNVLMYTINAATRALTSVGTVAADSLPTSIAFHPSGKFAYVANAGSNNVSLDTIDTTTGTLTSAGLVAPWPWILEASSPM